MCILFTRFVHISVFLFQALEYIVQYQDYSMVWLKNQNDELSTFLSYGRDLTLEELEIQYDVDEEGNPLVMHSSPKLIDFQNKVHVKKNYTFNYLYKIFLRFNILLYLD